MVNCKYGPRVVGSGNYLGNVLVVADTANLRYGNSLELRGLAQHRQRNLPHGSFLTKPQVTDVPLPSRRFCRPATSLGQVYTMGLRRAG